MPFGRLAFVLGAGCLAASCSLSNTISNDSVDYNLALENAANRSILSNVLRAKDRKRLHFTALSQIRGQLKLQASASASALIPFGGGSDNKYSLSPSAGLTYSTNPSFDVAVLDSQKFMQGILSPVKMQVLDHYWEQGWPREILLHMFIRKVEFSRNIRMDNIRIDNVPIKKKVFTQVVNFPENPAEMAAFQKFIRWLLARGLRPGRTLAISNIGPPVSGSGIDLEQLVKAAEQKFTVVHVAGTKNYRLQKKSTSIVFCIGLEPLSTLKKRKDVYGAKSDVIDLGSRICKRPKGLETESEGIASLGVAFGQDLQESVSLRDGTRVTVKIPKDTQFVFYLRSIEGMIYYLGEITRTLELQGRKIEMIVGDAPTSLFVLTTEDSASGFEVGVAYGDAIYGIPRTVAQAGRSMHVLSLVGQLLALHKSADEIPSTRAVTIVGP